MKIKLYMLTFVIGLILFAYPLATSMIIYNPQTLSNCDSTTGWSSGSATLLPASLDNSAPYQGSGSVQFTYMDPGLWHTWLRYSSSAFGMTYSTTIISVTIRSSTTAHTLTPMIEYWKIVNGAQRNYVWQYPIITLTQANTWQTFEMDFSSALVQGTYRISGDATIYPTDESLDYPSVSMIQFQVNDNPQPPPVGTTFNFDALLFGSGSASPTPTPTPTPGPTPTPTPSPSASPTPTPSPTASPSPTPTPTPPPSPPPNPNPDKVNLIISATEGGTTNPAPGTYEYDVNSTITIEALPDNNNSFLHWIANDGTEYFEQTLSLTLTQSMSIQARFTISSPAPPNELQDYMQTSGIFTMVGSVIWAWYDLRKKKRE